MKRSFYLFNPGIMERKDNTLKYTPVKIDDDGTEHPQPPRYIPVEDVAEMYVFGSLRANSALYNFLGQKDIPVHFFDYYENYTGSFMPRDGLLSGRALLAQANLSFQLICSDNLLRLVFLRSTSFSPYLFRLVSRFTADWNVKPESLCNLNLLPDKRCYLSGMPLPFNTSYVPHFVKHVQRRGEHAVKVCCLPDVSDI